MLGAARRRPFVRPTVLTVGGEPNASGNFALVDHASHPQRIARTSPTADNTDLFPSANGSPTGAKAVEVPLASQTVSVEPSVGDRRRVPLQGFGAGAFYSGSYGITLSSVPAQHRGVSSAVVTSGVALGSASAGAAYALTVSWRAPYLFILAPTLLAAGVMALLIKGVPTPPRVPGGLSFLTSNRRFLTLSVANFCGLYGYMVIFTWGPSFLVESHGLSVTRSGVFVALVALTSLAGAAWGRMSDRLGRKRLTLWMFGTSAVLVWLVRQFDPTSSHASPVQGAA